jgi:5-methylcytosine-specific restriction endonuclease McrA
MTRIPPLIREKVRERANNRCEYCLIPELPNVRSFHVDHIKPAKKHKGSDELYNLAWACFDCNTTKSGEIAGYDPVTNQLTPLYNPRTQNWDEHFKKEGATIVPVSAFGRVTVELLEMNDPAQIEFRTLLIQLGLW